MLLRTRMREVLRMCWHAGLKQLVSSRAGKKNLARECRRAMQNPDHACCCLGVLWLVACLLVGSSGEARAGPCLHMHMDDPAGHPSRLASLPLMPCFLSPHFSPPFSAPPHPQPRACWRTSRRRRRSASRSGRWCCRQCRAAQTSRRASRCGQQGWESGQATLGWESRPSDTGWE